MADKNLARLWAGMSRQDITHDWTVPEAARFCERIAGWQTELTVNVLHAVMNNAEKGDLQAIQWLAERGLIDLPRKAEG